MPKTSDILTALESSHVETDFEQVFDSDKASDAWVMSVQPSSLEIPGIPTEADDSHFLRLLIHVYLGFKITTPMSIETTASAYIHAHFHGRPGIISADRQ